MKLTPELLTKLKQAVAQAGGAGEFARRCGIDAANISRYLSGKVRSVSDDNWSKLEPRLGMERAYRPHLTEAGSARDTLPYQSSHLGYVPDTIANTAELRECIKDAMMRQQLSSGAELNRFIGYDSPRTLERLLTGQLAWFPDVLSLVLDALNIDYAATPLSEAERELLAPPGIFRDGGLLVRPLPVVSWANAASQLSGVIPGDTPVLENWDAGTTDTVLSPVGGRKDTLAFRVCGISMEPNIMDNDIILVEPCHSIDEIGDGKVAVVKFRDEVHFPDSVVCKRFHRSGGSFLLTSDNPAGKIISFEREDLAWIGVVVRKISEM